MAIGWWNGARVEPLGLRIAPVAGTEQQPGLSQEPAEEPPPHLGRRALDTYRRAARRPEEERPRVRAEHLMSSPAVTIHPEATVAEARRVLKERGFRHLPVAHRGRLVGILAERDLLPLVSGPDQTRPVQGVMSTRVLTVSPDAEVRDIARVMLDEGIHSVPVLEDERLVGIITSTDILQYVVNSAPVDLWT